MAADRFIAMETIRLIAKNLRECAALIDRIAYRVDGFDRDEMIVGASKATEITRAFTCRVGVLRTSVDQFEVDLFGVNSPPLPAAQAPYYLALDEASSQNPSPLGLTPAEGPTGVDEHPSLLLAPDEEDKKIPDTDEPDKKKRRI